MRRAGLGGLNPLAIAPAMAGVAALAAFVLLSAFAKPAHYQERTRALNAELAEAQSLLGVRGDDGAYLPRALCGSAPDQAALDLRRRLQTQALAASVAIADVSTAPDADGALSGGITPVRLRFSASGRYEQVIGLLGTLARSEPQIFVDSLDLKPEGQSTQLKLVGRVLCATSVRR